MGQKLILFREYRKKYILKFIIPTEDQLETVQLLTISMIVILFFQNFTHLPRTGAPSMISYFAIVSLSLYELGPLNE